MMFLANFGNAKVKSVLLKIPGKLDFYRQKKHLNMFKNTNSLKQNSLLTKSAPSSLCDISSHFSLLEE